MALNESPNECAPVREIYAWIEAHFPFYRTCSNTGWKSSIRHNLSFSKCFSKMNRAELLVHNRNKSATVNSPKSMNFDPRANGNCGLKKRNSGGTYWKVNPECQSFLIYSLKKSQYWLQNSASYPKLSSLIREYDLRASLGVADGSMSVWHHNHRLTMISTQQR